MNDRPPGFAPAEAAEKLKFYQKGTFTVGNRLVAEEERSVQASTERRNTITCGHRACQGCGEALGARYALDAAMLATGNDLIAATATGCLEVFTSRYPETSWQLAWVHSLFGNAAAVATGIAAAIRVKKRRTRVIAQGGDGATSDIGFGCLSGLFERNDDVLYVCYDNEGYMTTGGSVRRRRPQPRAQRPRRRLGQSRATSSERASPCRKSRLRMAFPMSQRRRSPICTILSAR